MRRAPEGFHVVNSMDRGDHVGLTPEEVAEERRARGESPNGRSRPRGPRHIAATRPPFEIALKECGLYDRVKELAQARGVAVVELHCEGRPTQRVQRARQDVYRLLKSLDWSSVDIGRLFDRDHSSILAALK